MYPSLFINYLLIVRDRCSQSCLFIHCLVIQTFTHSIPDVRNDVQCSHAPTQPSVNTWAIDTLFVSRLKPGCRIAQ